MIHVQDVAKLYGRTVALRPVSFEAGPGELVLLRGSNGSGKSTLLRVLAGFATPDRGQCIVDAQAIGWCGHDHQMIETLSVRDNLTRQTRLFGISPDRLDAACERFGVDQFQNRRPGQLSQGMRQRAMLARAFAVADGVLLLDEPQTGLDQRGIAILWEATAAYLDSGGCCVIATHLELPEFLTSGSERQVSTVMLPDREGA